VKKDYGQQPKEGRDTGLLLMCLAAIVVAIVVLYILPAME
jgi:hypothetical protein